MCGARFIGGLGIGASSVLGPMYIAEIAPPELRGRLVGFFQFNIVFGILLAYFSNYVVGTMGFGDAEWRWKLGIAADSRGAVPADALHHPGKPALAGQAAAAWTKPKRCCAAPAIQNYQQDLAEIVASLDARHGGADEPLFSRKYRLPIFLAVSIGMFNQLSGINAILYYLNDIFAKAGFTKVSGDLQAVAVGATNLMFTMWP